MLISEVIQIRSKLNIIKLDAILTKLGGKTYIKLVRGRIINFSLSDF